MSDPFSGTPPHGQDAFLQVLHNQPVYIRPVGKAEPIIGALVGWDASTLTLSVRGISTLVYKSAVVSIVPAPDVASTE